LPLSESHRFAYAAEVFIHGPVLLITLDAVERVRRGDLILAHSAHLSAAWKEESLPFS
jgi:hypothetical protein